MAIAAGAIYVCAAVAVALIVKGGDEGGSAASEGSESADEALFAYDATRPLEVAERERTARREVTYSSFDGRRVRAVFAPPAGETGPYRCVIFQGGITYTLEDFEVLAPLRRLGYAVLSVQPRSSGDGGQNQLRAAADPRRLKRMMRATVIDLRRGVDYLLASGDCEPGIGYIGGSFGGMLGALLAGVDERVSAVALIVAGGDWRRLVIGNEILLPGIEDRARRFRAARRLLAPVDPAHWVGRISPRPLLMVNGRFDPLIVPPAARALHQAAAEPKQVAWLPGGHYLFDGASLQRRAFALIGGFFRRQL